MLHDFFEVVMVRSTEELGKWNVEFRNDEKGFVTDKWGRYRDDLTKLNDAWRGNGTRISFEIHGYQEEARTGGRQSSGRYEWVIPMKALSACCNRI
jgi:hypothetical protein